jgi:hypothetical protein
MTSIFSRGYRELVQVEFPFSKVLGINIVPDFGFFQILE